MMKVNLRRVEEMEGMLFKKQVFTVFVDVELSPDEIKAIKAPQQGTTCSVLARCLDGPSVVSSQFGRVPVPVRE